MTFAYCTIKLFRCCILYDRAYVGPHVDVKLGFGNEELDGEGRVICLEFQDFNLVSVYTPGVGELKRLDFRVWYRSKK